MPHYTEDKCTRCGNKTSPELLMVKRVQFLARLNMRKVLKTRVTDWLCESCLEKDEDFNREAYATPGHTSSALERVRSGEILE